MRRARPSGTAKPISGLVAAEREVHDLTDTELDAVTNQHLVRTLQRRCKLAHVVDRHAKLVVLGAVAHETILHRVVEIGQ